MEYYERIKKLRVKNKFSQQEMSSKLGLNQSHYQKIESGKVRPMPEHLIILSKILDVSIDFILTGKNYYS